MSTIRGHQGQFKIYQDGAFVNVANITRVDVNQDSSFSRSNYVGDPVPKGDQSCEGWSGTLDAEVADAAIDEFIDALVENNLNGIGVSDYTFTTTENYPDGTSKSYVYFDCQFKMSRSNPGGTEKVTKRLEFQASGRKPL